MEWVIVEREFDPPVTADAARAGRDALDCQELYGVEPVRSYLAQGGRRMVCVFRAPDAEAVRTVLRNGGSGRAKVWAGTEHNAEKTA
ncbi:MAG: nickel-binding protein [Polyangiales bacterium]